MTDAEERLAALSEDRSLGSSEISRRAAAALVDRAHPAMASLLDLADRAVRAEGDPKALQAMVEDLERRLDELAREAASLVEAGATVATHSRSGSVLRAVERAVSERDVAVLVGESRPGGEGIWVARTLREAGCRVTLTADAALHALLDDADLLMVGADALTARGFVNKAGTAALLRSAEAADVGAFVVAGTDKLWPAAADVPPLGADATLDVEVPDGVEVRAPRFEVAPLEPVTAVITEEGPWPGATVRDRAAARRVDGDLLDAVQGSR